MPKVNKAFSIDPETFMMLDRYCAASETWDKRKSRSKVVNEAIRWYLQGDVAELQSYHEKLKENFRQVCIERDQLMSQITVSPLVRGNKSWWRTLLRI